MPDFTDAHPSSKLGEYTVIQDIAEGTFGKVKLAVHAITGHRVAMKFISKATIHRERAKTRVRREYEYLRALRHPHIIKLYEVISTKTDVIFVMEYAGGELFNYIVEHGAMPESRGRKFFQALISGIEYSHRLKIVHRDLKPENVLLDDDLNVKIADFGLSSEISDGDFLSTSCGSPNYAAPEVIRGGIYAGPEIDVWSAGVILYVMLCGRLPFEDDDVHALFSKISKGEYFRPTHLSPDAKDLIARMLVVDPVQRITVPEITKHPFYLQDLPEYLHPLPPPPAVVGTLSEMVSPPVPVDFELIEGLGRIEPAIVEELSNLLTDMSREEIWDALRKDDGVQGNTLKIAYMLLRDKRRLGRDLAEYEEQEREAQILAMDPRNALSPVALSPGGNDLQENPFFSELSVESDLEDDPDGLDLDDSDTNSEIHNFAVLNSSLPEEENKDASSSHHLAEFATAKRSHGREKRHARTKWHFGIRSQSPPMEIMLEIYKTLKVLGMEWKEKKNLGGLGGVKTRMNGEGKIERMKDMDGGGDVDLRAASGIYFVETRARVQDVVILMNLQLYNVDSSNYLVDFHHKGSYRARTDSGAGRFDRYDSTCQSPVLEDELKSIKERDGPKEDEVVSPYVFMDVACRLILELAGGSE